MEITKTIHSILSELNVALTESASIINNISDKIAQQNDIVGDAYQLLKIVNSAKELSKTLHIKVNGDSNNDKKQLKKIKNETLKKIDAGVLFGYARDSGYDVQQLRVDESFSEMLQKLKKENF